MKNSCYKKTLVFGIFVLFIGIAVVPGITAQIYVTNNNSLETYAEELIECPIEIYGIEGLLKYTVMLTQQQIDELDVLFNNIKADLNNVETEEATITIFNNAIVSLDELGLLPADMSVEEVQQLIVNCNVNAGELNLQYVEDKENFDCYILGRTSNTYFKGKEGDIAFGLYYWMYLTGGMRMPAMGFVWTIGSNGVKIWLGQFMGKLGIVKEGDWEYEGWRYYIGAEGFKGYKIKILFITYILGNASHVAFTPYTPPPLRSTQNNNQASQSNSKQSSISSINYKQDFNIVGREHE